MTDSNQNLAPTGGENGSLLIRNFRIPRPRSLFAFIITLSRWSLPNFNNLPALYRRVKTNLLYFQTNYLIVGMAIFALLM